MSPDCTDGSALSIARLSRTSLNCVPMRSADSSATLSMNWLAAESVTAVIRSKLR